MVAGVRTHRKESKPMIARSAVFLSSARSYLGCAASVDAGDFRLVDRSILDQLKTIDDAQPYVRGLISELARNQTGFSYTRQKREFDESKFPAAPAGAACRSAASCPIRSYRCGLPPISAFSFARHRDTHRHLCLARLFTSHEWPSGFATTTVLILSGISLNAIFLGVIGEYVGRIYVQVRKRPTVIIEQSLNIDEQ